jgi:hypothetical protein
MSDDTEFNPFLSDPSIPEISSAGGEAAFTFPPPDEQYSIPAPAHVYPWKRPAIIGASAVALLLIGAGLVFFLWPKIFNTPEKAVRAYYSALQIQDTERMREYLDPDDLVISNEMPLVLDVKDEIEGVVNAYGLGVSIEWEFRDLVYRRVEKRGNYAQVEVNGQLRLYEVNTDLGFMIPYQITHNLIRKNGKWLITRMSPLDG